MFKSENEKEMFIHDLKYQKRQFVLMQTGILKALNQISEDIYNPEDLQIKSILNYLEVLELKEKEIEMKIIEAEVTPVDLGEK